MKQAIILSIAVIVTLSANALADVKVKTRQTMSGQTTENTTYIKGKRQRTEMMGGIMVSITQCDLGRDLQLNPATKTYTISEFDNAAPAQPTTTTQTTSAPAEKGGTMFVTTTIKDTGERKQMFGYTARHIIQTIVTETSPDACVPSNTKMEMDMWVIDAEFGLACDQTRYYHPYKNTKNGGCQDKIVPKTIGSAKSGYPVWQKMTSFDAGGKESFSTISEVVELSKATLESSLFDVPGDFRQVNDASAMYASAATSPGSQTAGSNYGTSNTNSSSIAGISGSASNGSASPGMSSGLQNSAATQAPAPNGLEAKKPGTLRVGIAVKTTSVGEGIAANDLSAAVQNTFSQFLKGTNVEIVPLEARLAAAQSSEAAEKQCDFVLTVSAAHKKGGGGGFGGFGKMLGSVAPMLPMGGTVAGAVASQVVTTAIITATSVSGNVKSKDELSLDLKLVSTANNAPALSRQFKTKAKSDGDDIISALVEQAAQAILDSVAK